VGNVITLLLAETKRVGDGYLINTAKNIQRKGKFEKSKKGSIPNSSALGGERDTNLQDGHSGAAEHGQIGMWITACKRGRGKQNFFQKVQRVKGGEGKLRSIKRILPSALYAAGRPAVTKDSKTRRDEGFQDSKEKGFSMCESLLYTHQRTLRLLQEFLEIKETAGISAYTFSFY
jgi:hypothetical protein